MTVAEYIAKLQAMPQGALVVTYDGYFDECYSADGPDTCTLKAYEHGRYVYTSRVRNSAPFAAVPAVVLL